MRQRPIKITRHEIGLMIGGTYDLLKRTRSRRRRANLLLDVRWLERYHRGLCYMGMDCDEPVYPKAADAKDAQQLRRWRDWLVKRRAM